MKKLKLILFFLLFSLNIHAENTPYIFDINEYNGKVVYLDFWASWCIPCRKSFPWMNSMHNKYEDLVIIAVNLDEDKNEASRFLENFPANFTIAYDNGQLAEKFNVKGMPFSILFDKKGQVVKEHIGFKDKDTNEYEETFKATIGGEK